MRWRWPHRPRTKRWQIKWRVNWNNVISNFELNQKYLAARKKHTNPRWLHVFEWHRVDISLRSRWPHCGWRFVVLTLFFALELIRHHQSPVQISQWPWTLNSAYAWAIVRLFGPILCVPLFLCSIFYVRFNLIYAICRQNFNVGEFMMDKMLTLLRSMIQCRIHVGIIFRWILCTQSSTNSTIFASNGRQCRCCLCDHLMRKREMSAK